MSATDTVAHFDNIHGERKINHYYKRMRCLVCARTASYRMHLEPNTKPNVHVLGIM